MDTIITEGELLAAVTALMLKASKVLISPEETTFLNTAEHILETDTSVKVDKTTGVLIDSAKNIAQRIVRKLLSDGYRAPILRLLASQLDVQVSQRGGGKPHTTDRMNPVMLLITAINVEMTLTT